jgi:arsenate reductase
MSQKPMGLLFLCVANSARSQMAEGFARAMAPAGVECFSAGSEPSRLNPHAVDVMREVGIDISSQRAKGIDGVPVDRVGTVITLCAEEVCPVFPGDVTRHHWPLDDPAAVEGVETETLEAFRRVRDAIRSRLEGFLARHDPRRP